ncbi:MAG: OmpA family protein [Pseudomonadota bacterium]
MAQRRNAEAPVIIKRPKKCKCEDHGGNWKVALADFMTSMFIFCLAMWLLNITTTEQKLGVADYFAPTSVSKNTSGSGGVLGGQSIIIDGTFQAGGPPSVITQGVPETVRIPLDVLLEEQDIDGVPVVGLAAELGVSEGELTPFANVARDVSEALQNLDLPETDQGELVEIDLINEGLRITLRDLEGQPMFASGSDTPLTRTVEVLGEIAPILADIPNEVRVIGHTDAVPYAVGPGGAYSNWELSADRANAARRVLVNSGVGAGRMSEVVGKAASEPFTPDNPTAAENRRIEIIVLRDQQRRAQVQQDLRPPPVEALESFDAPPPPTRLLQ